MLTLAFEQWFAEPYFYDKLTDREEQAVLIFEQVKNLIDAEALSPYASSAASEPPVIVLDVPLLR